MGTGKTCSKCGTFYEDVAANFYTIGQGRFDPSCKDCRREYMRGARARRQGRAAERAADTKRCTKCRVLFPLSDFWFYRRDETPDGFMPSCKLCHPQYRVRFSVLAERDGGKTCRRCGIHYEDVEANFARGARYAGGFVTWCKACSAVLREEYMTEHRDEVYARAEAVRRARGVRPARPVEPRTTDEGRRCSRCHRRFKDVAAAFESNGGQGDGFHPYCKECRRDSRRFRNQHRRARRYRAEGRFTRDDIQRRYDLQQGRCYWCDEDLGGEYHIDHRIPLSRGGANDPSNLVIACPFCNQSKGDRMPWEFAGVLL